MLSESGMESKNRSGSSSWPAHATSAVIGGSRLPNSSSGSSSNTM